LLLNPEGKSLFLTNTPSSCPTDSIPQGNHDKFPTLPDGKRDVIRDWNHVEGWKQMEALVATGKAKSIGVCNVRSKLAP
jgi:diketogulonate reductase-like aldo/keto reductase